MGTAVSAFVKGLFDDDLRTEAVDGGILAALSLRVAFDNLIQLEKTMRAREEI